MAATQFAVNVFTFQEETTLDDITFTQAGSATFQTVLAGYLKASGTLTFVYDTLNKPFLAPYSIVTGTMVAMVLQPDGAGSFTFPTAAIQNFAWGSGPKNGPVSCTINWQSSGSYTRPSS